MATTQEFYRLRARNVRYSTKLNTMSSGMYLTEQLIPEGYAKVMVNYDIDDTGSNIRNREGRDKLSELLYPGAHKFGPMHITDYLYAYNTTADEVESIKDVLLTYGDYADIREYTGDIDNAPDKKVYISKAIIHTDERVLDDDDTVIEPGSVYDTTYDNIWSLYCDRGSEDFNKATNADLGFVSARTIKNAYAFDKQIINDLGKPISTVMDNEIYAFTGDIIRAEVHPAQIERSTITNFPDPSLTKIMLKKTNAGYELHRQVLEARTLNAAEASSGFNMLCDEPFVFEDVPGGSPYIYSAMFYSHDAPTMPVLNPPAGVVHTMRVYYQYRSDQVLMQYKLEQRDADTDDGYTTLVDWTDAPNVTGFAGGTPITYDLTLPYAHTALRITLREKDNVASEFQLPKIIDTTITVPLEFKKYNLTTAKGMINWQDCIGVYGVESAPNTIFFSATSDPTYFPFPYNTVTLDNEILAVHKYLEMLLVITTDGVWLLKPSTSILTTTQKQILANVFIPELDAINVVVLKDQIFFKTDTRFYVLKPNAYTSDASDLKNFDNSTAIANYTTKFTKETLDILNKVYRPITEMQSHIWRQSVKFTDFDVLDTQSVVKYSDVHYVYTILPKITATIKVNGVDTEVTQTYGRLNLHIVYDTVTRSFRLYTIGIGEDDVAHSALLYRNKQSGAYYEIIARNGNNNTAAVSIVKKSGDIVTDNIQLLGRDLTPYYNNYQFIDTGHVSLDDTYLKRFREVQFNLVNKEHTINKFYSDFKVDGRLRISSTEYEVQQITDHDDPEYGLIYVVPTSSENLMLYGDTSLDCEEVEVPQYWQLDLSKFPNLTVTTVRLRTLGKGRRGSLELLNISLKKFNLSSMVWVYRIMNVR
jgi:hypothetical protein